MNFVGPHHTPRVHTVAANTYIAHRSLRGWLAGTIWPPELDPLAALVVRLLWLNGSSLGAQVIRAEFALPASTLSSALRRLEDRGFVRRHPNRIDARYVDVVLTRSGKTIAVAVTELINELDRDVRDATGEDAPVAFERIATALAVMDEEG